MRGETGFSTLFSGAAGRLLGVISLGLLLVWAFSRSSPIPETQTQSVVQIEPDTISQSRAAGSVGTAWKSKPHIAYTEYAKLDEVIGLLGGGNDLDSGDLQRAKLLLDQVFHAGSEALPTIHDFLLSGADVAFPVTLGDESHSLRLILIQMLSYIDDPEVVEVALDAMQSTREPMEVYLLSSIVNDWSEPGWHDEGILNFVERVLQHEILEGKVDSLGPLIQVLGEQGDETTAGKLADMPSYLQQSAAVAMAQLPDGSGIPFLVDEIRDSGSYTLQGRLALRLLAQSAAAQPNAANELVRLAAENKIPLEMWLELMKLINGDERLQLVITRGQRADQEIIFHPEGDEIWYRVRSSSPDIQGKQTRALLDQLYSVTTDNDVRRMLKNANQLF